MDSLVRPTLSARLSSAEGPAPCLPGGSPVTLAEVLRRASEAATPGRVIKVGSDGDEVVLGYGEVRDRAERILGGLRAIGTSPGDEVVLQVETAEEFIPALWACILGGFPAVPVGVVVSPEGVGPAAQRLRDVWTLLDRPAVLAGTGLAEPVHALLGADARVVSVAELAAHAPDPSWHLSPPEAIAVLLLSSGTTGRPKLIQRSHHNLLCVCQRSPGLAGYAGRQITFLNWLPLDHNAGLTSSLSMLAAGADQIQLGTRDVLEAPERWLDGLHRYRVTHTGGTNYSLGLINAHLAAAGERAWDFACVESFVVSAEPVVARTLREFLEHMAPYGLRPETLRPAYGMSEVGGIARLTELRLDEGGDGDSFVEAGTLLPGISLRVVDAGGRVVEEGCEGRIQVRGDTVTPGYARDPDHTRESFTSDGWFITGDTGFLRAASLMITGREKDVVIVNGLNIPSQEIEAAVEEVAGVERGCTAVCAVRGSGRDTEAVAVFLHPVLAGAEERDALRREVRRVVASHFGATVASVLMLGRDEIPRTPLGKIRRSALRLQLEAGSFAGPAAEDAQAGGGEAWAAPRTRVERELCTAWAEVLGVDRVGIHDGFLGLGGHSLLAARVVSRVRGALGVELPLRVLFEAPNVAELAERVEALRLAQLPPIPPVLPVERTAAPPASFAQERLWFLDRLQPESPLYNLPVPLRLEGELDGAALERAIGEIVRRHESLRTTFAEADGLPVQVVAPFDGFVLHVEDLSGMGGEELEAEVRRRAAEDAARPFDLSAGPLFRAGLLRLGEGEHVLLLCMHHIVSDGWSLNVFSRELAQLYAAYRSGRESPLPELAVQYADHAFWQRRQLRGEMLDRQLSWWKEQLSGAPQLLELPTDHARPAVQTHRGALEPILIGRELQERIEALGRREGATPFMVLLGAFQVLLSKYGGSEDVVVGSTIAGRTRGEVEALVGLFMNMLVLRTDLSGDPSFREVLRRVREVTLSAYEHQDVPFERLVEELRPERSLGHSPLVQVLFELQDTGGPGADLPGLTVRRLEAEVGGAKFDLSVALSTTPRGLAGGLTYGTDLFDRSTARRMVEFLERVLEQAAADPDAELSRLSLLGSRESGLLEAWNRTAAEYPAQWCVHELFEAQVERTPDAVAVVFGGRTLTYRELEERANRLARRLARLGVGPEVRVGLCLERDLELMVALLGVMKSGGAYVPVDPAHPAKRVGYVLEDSGVAVLLTQDRLRERLPELPGVRVVSVDAQGDPAAGESAAAPESGVAPENLCYVIYTSGSTGRPKGVAMHHRGVCNYIHWGIRAYGADEGGGAPVFSSMAVDLTITNLLPLFAGRAVHLLPEENALDALADALRARSGFGVIKITPVHLSLLTPLLTPEEARGAARTLVIGADFLSAETTVFWQEHAPGVRLMNEYGPTETVVGCSAYTLPPGAHRSGPVPVGGPIQNMRFHVLDAHGQPVPVGVAGELYIGGVGVARGYLGRPGLSAEKFVPEPFGEAGARMYRTGDRARWLDGGSLLILGRTDNQVKLRGYRVELGEIEAVLRRHEAVAGCLVVVREDEPGDRRLVAYVVGGAPTEALRAHLRASLPEYMVPSAFVRLGSLPRTTTGKIDPRTLPAPEYAAEEARYVAPSTPTEELLAAIWGEVLEVKRVGAADNFFELGGHSLLAMLVILQIRRVFDIAVPLRAVFERPTVAELADRVEQLQRADLPQPPPIVPVGRTRALPLSSAQERLWFLDRLQPESAFYNVPLGLRLGGVLVVPALERALGELVRRHEALRTVFREENGSPLQVVTPYAGFRLPVEDLSSLGEAQREAEVARQASDDAVRPFDLAAGPLVRARLLRLGGEEHVLLLCLHHVVSDGWSMGVLFRELSALYRAYRDGGESPLPALAVQYADYAVWEREQLGGEVLERQLSYWRAQLAGAPALLELPTDHPRPEVQTYRGARERIELPADLLNRLEMLGRREGATLYMVLLGAFQVLLARYAATDDVIVGSPIAGRARAEVQGLIGFFVNTLVLRTDLSGDPSFREALRRVREVTLGAYEHQEVPFERLVEELQPERSLRHSPLFQVVLALVREAEASRNAIAGMRTEPVVAENATTKFDLSLTFVEHAGGLRAVLEYATALFEAGTARQMLAHLARLLEQVGDDADRRLSTLELLEGAEREQVTAACNRTGRDYPSAPVHVQFAEQARRTPDAVALLHGGDAVSYAALDRRAEMVARRLRASGVGLEVPVGLCVGRTPELLAGVLGIWKAGGAYVPLDPEYPAERLAWMVADARLPVLLAAGSAADSLSHPGVAVIRADAPVDADGADSLLVEAGVSADNLAYVVYTSGSTGRPKGVLVQHGSLGNLLAATREVFGVRPGDVMPALASYSFDIWLFEALLPLTSGAAVRLIDRERVLDVPSMMDEAADATLLHAVPALMRQVVQVECEAPRLGRLRRAFVGGDRVPADLLAEMDAALPGAETHVLYGPTEGCILASAHPVPAGAVVEGSPIGRPLGNVRLYVCDPAGGLQPPRVPGELLIGGAGVSRGYLGRPGPTAERFVPDPFGPAGGRLYRTGDRVRRREDGSLEYLGRLDGQVKVRGFRIEPGEVEAALRRHPGVRECVVVARDDSPGGRRLVAYVAGGADAGALRGHLRRELPDYMIPDAFVVMDDLPVTPNGKLDRRALPAPSQAGGAASPPPRGALEERVAEVWSEVLGAARIGIYDNFFDLGGTSLLLYRVFSRLRELRADLRLVDLFRYTTVEALAAHLGAQASNDGAGRTQAPGRGAARRRAGASVWKPSPAAREHHPVEMQDRESDIAVVGMSCRLPGARNTAEFWNNLCGGAESISFFSEQALLDAGVPPETLRDPSYVRAYGAMPEAWCFDAPFFGVSRREAEAMDPQHRVMLECAWSALEDAGCDPARYPGAVAVFAGSGSSSAYLARVMADAELVAAVGRDVAQFGNARDFLTTRVSYKLGLHGPSVVVQTACSTSLVAIHLACQSLLNRECDLALAGGVTLAPSQVSGYHYQEGGIVSPDGHCRAFDARAAGTVGGSGAGVVALKRFVDAVREGNTIHAVVKGSAINNDGSGKVGFTAPSVKGQANAIAEALEVAGVDPSDVSYVETHGTGTALGDPIEIAALTEVFRTSTDRRAFCALGAAKTNIGHTDTAAGVAGFIKTVLALKHRMLPPTLHFQAPNPETGLEGSPFYVNTALSPWRGAGPLRAGVSSFGMGGTNAHAVLEEAPELPAPAATDAAQLLVLSAKSEAALARMRDNLAAHLAEHPGQPLANVAYTLQEGRAALPYRWATVVRDAQEAREALAGGGARKPVSQCAAKRPPTVAFLFPGQGTQHAGMARELYDREPAFRAEIDRCADLLAAGLEMDLRSALFPPDGGEAEADAVLRQTRYTQPALFAVEYALAQLWMSWGVRPEAMLGHSIGEYVAACIAGVFSLEDALRLVAARGRLIQGLPAGAMLAVPLSEADVRPLLAQRLSLAAVNSASHCVVSGEPAGIDGLEAVLAGRDVAARRLHTSHAFHSADMDAILDTFAAEVRRARPAAPTIPFVSNVTGDWITVAESVDPRYWVRHLRETVRFAEGVGRLLDDPQRVLLEVGPGETLSTFARRHERSGAGRVIVRSLPRADASDASDLTVLEAAGALWTAGVEVDWPALRRGDPRCLVPLPTYPFDRTEYRVERHPASPVPAATPRPAAADPARTPLPYGQAAAAAPVQATDRRSRIAAAVTGLFASLLGAEPAQLDGARTFLELGADSLLLMQASRTLESSFGVKVPFRRLLEGLSTIDHLAAHLNGCLAADAALPGDAPVPPPAAVPQPAPAADPAPEAAPGRSAALAGDDATLRELFAQQLAIINRQLDLLAGGTAPPGSPAAPAVNGKSGAHAHAAAPVPAARPVQVADAVPASDSHGPHRSVRSTLGLGGGYTERQALHFARLVESYTARTRRSKEYAAENRPHLSDNRASLGFRLATKELMYPVVGKRSEGARLWDVDGNEYVDFTIGFGVHFFGHRPAFIVQAVEEQLRSGFHLGPQSDLAGPAARLLRELTGMERVTFCNTGSEAVMTALRIARTATGRAKVVQFEGSYHGCFDGILARPAGTGAPGSRPVAPGTQQGMVDDVVVLRYGAPETLEWLAANALEVAAVLVEPVQSRNPEFHPREFLRELRSLTEAAGTVLIFDEMITGLRLEARGAQGFYGIEADLVTYGKVIGGGFPLGVVAGRARYMDAIDGGAWSFGDDSYPAADQTFFAGTFCKHPVTMAAAYAVLSHLKERGPALYDELNARTSRLVAALRRVIHDEDVPIRILSCASLFHFRPDPQYPFGDLLFYHMLQRGVYIWEGRACFLSTAHTDEDCDRLVQAFRDSIVALRDGGFLPERPGPGGGPAGPSGASPAREAGSAETSSTFPLTPAQRQIWVHAQLGDDASRAYNEQIIFGLRGRFDAGAMRAAVTDVMRHHEALRLVFDASGELQRVLDHAPVPLFVEDVAASDEELAAAMGRAVRTVFDLRTGPLLRVHVHPRGPERNALQMVVHHLVADGFSGPLLRRDLLAAYRARLDGRTPVLDEAMQFSRYAALLAARADADAASEAEWLERFRGAVPLELPADRHRPPLSRSRAETARLTLRLPLVSRLRELGRQQECTLFTTLLAGLLATLHRVAGQDDLVVGIPSADRPFPGSDSLVGHCVDVLPIRSRIAGTESGMQFLREVRGRLLDAYEHEVFTYARLHEKVQVPRGPSAAPLISVLFNLEPGGGPAEGVAAPGAAVVEVEPVVGASAPFTKFDLNLDAVDTGGEIELTCLFNTDLFERGTVQRILGQLLRVLEQLPDARETSIADLALMGPEERRLVVEEWNRTEAEFPADRCIHHLFEAQVERTPGAAAVVSEGESLTFRELNARANRLAHHLRGRGVGPEVRVGVLMERGLEMVTSLLAVLKAGGAYVPLDPGHPAERLAYVLRDSGVPLVLAQRALRGALPARTSVEVLEVDGEADRFAAECSENPRGGAAPQSLAYVIYTSGSTGKPKGVMNAHGGVVNRLAWMQARFGIGADDVVLQKTPFSFDVSVWEFFWPLQQGARLVMARPDGHRDPAYLQEAVERHGVTTLHFVPSMLQQFVEAADAARCASLARVVCSGEALAPALVNRFHDRFPPSVSLHNLYGPTEAAVDVSCWTCARGRPVDLVPIGRPVWNTALYVLDGRLRPLPPGVPGELYIGGVQVARGYLNRPGLTADRFVPDPLGGAPGARLYRTGDRARWLTDGVIEYLGRLDDQVKIRGFRVELGEIEAALREHAEVRDCVVVAREDGSGDRRLVAYVVGGADEAVLRGHLRLTLPEPMLPGAFVFLDALPLSANGKLDRRSLPAPAPACAGGPYAAPRTPVEEVLAGIWAEVLGLERVGTRESFFELGGHSLLATRVSSRVRSAFGVETTVRLLFENPTVSALAERVEEIRRAGMPVPPPLVPVERTGSLPLSFAQERLWFLDRLQGESSHYNMSSAMRVPGPLDLASLERALAEIVRRHEPLRTTFREVDGAPVQVIAPFAGFTLPVEDRSGPDAADPEARAKRWLAEEAARPFDLSAGPLFSPRLLRLGDEEHVLLLRMHHIVSDWWSMGVLFGELSALYEAFREGRETPLPELTVQYADYAVWQRERPWGRALERQLAYWREQLAGAPALQALPTDRPRPAVQTHRGAREPVELPAALAERLATLARREGATLFMVVLGAFQVLLARYAGGGDVVVGSPTAGRTRREVEELVGFFVNTLVLRTDLSGDPGFREVLRRVREVTLGAYEHQEVPFERLVAELQPARSLSHSPLFQVMFSLHHAGEPQHGLPWPGARGVDAEVGGTTKFDLSLELVARPGGVAGALEYSTDLFDRSTALRMLGHLARVMEQAAENPDVRLSELELLDEAERSRVVVAWNATAAAYPAVACIHELFEAQVERAPDAPAVLVGGRTLCYAELNAHTNKLARHLAGLGVGPDVRVGVCMERSLEMVVGLLAIHKAGGAYVPLDPAYPADRLRAMVEECAPVVVLTQASGAGLFAGMGVPTLDIGAGVGVWSGHPDTNLGRAAVGLRPDHLAYVIYTSGSTGQPKGVMIEHRSLVNHMAWQRETFGIGPSDTVLQRTSISFDASVWELWTPLVAGARMVLLPPDAAKDPVAVSDAIQRGGITVALFVPTLLQAVLRALPVDARLPSRTIFCGGEPLPGALVKEARTRGVGEVVNLYGPTEATINATSWVCGDPIGEGAPSIGRPIRNTRVYLLDRAGRPVPVGVVGELYIGGVGVARGYLDRPGQTAERFVPDPFGGSEGGRLYRTGDIGRWLADGTVEFLGRNDFQVKVRGFRIELGEVEARLAEHPDVREAVVVAHGDGSGETRLVAYYVGAEAVQPQALREHLSGSLPEYMVPAGYVRMEAFPLTTNGKLERRALPAPEGDAYATRAYQPPLGEVETALAEIWADVLRVERVGRWDHFFELGGHSLRAVQAVSRVRQVLGVEATLGELFLRPVLADFARGLDQAVRSELPAISPVDRGERLELSFAQQRLWFLDRMGSAGTAYHVPARLRLRGDLDRAALVRALDRIVARHEALRTTFVRVDGEPVQRIQRVDDSRFPLLDHDLADHPEREEVLRRLAAEEADVPFDLEQGPVVRGRLVRLADDDHALLITMHHIASDGWSLDLLVNELSLLYAAFLKGEPDPLPPLPVQYADYAAWQRRWLDGEPLQRQRDYWKTALSGAPERLELPTDRPRPAQQDFAGAAAGLVLDPELTAGLKGLGRRHGTTLFMTLLAGWATVLGGLSGQADVVVGTPAANRGRREIEGLIGFFVNTLALRVEMAGAPTVRELLGRVRERALAAQQHQDIPFERVVELVQPARSLAHSPLFQVVLAWQNTPGGRLELPGLTVSALDVAPYPSAKYDLSLALQEAEGRIAGGVMYATALFEHATVERWLGYLGNVLKAMVADDGRRLDGLALQPDAERAQVLEEWNRTGRAYPRDACVHELFEARTAERPDTVALVWDDVLLTYGELDARANRLANHLAALGVGPESRVGVLLDRGPELIVSMLAVLKAGGCYVPLDPGYPAERLGFMLADAGARVLLSRSDLHPSPAAAGARVVLLDRGAEAVAAESPEAPRSGATAENLTYIVYTSGSTGRPKGVMVNHRTVVQLVVETDYVRFGPGDRVAQASNASFDALAFEAWGALLNGATLVGVGRDVLLSPPALREFLRDQQITTLYQTTALLNQLAREQPDTVASLRELLFGGQQADADAVRRVLRDGRPQRLLHMYGPTETTAWCSCAQVEHVADDALTVPVGRPTGNQRIYILNTDLQPVPVGVPGEAYVGGGGVVRGYLDRPALTAERFLPDPYAAEPGARMYRTGDKLRWQADGTLEFIGRLDEQVKIRGFRIEPGEVESALSAHPRVDQSRVVAREDQPGEHRLVAYVVGGADADELREFLGATLPQYMVPAAFVVLDRLPLTPSGKLDVGALPRPDLESTADRYLAPRTPVEQALAAVWAEVLRVGRVGAKDDFFDLGGHSLLIMRLTTRVQAAFGVEIPIRSVFSAPTLEALAGEIERRIYEDIVQMSDEQAEQLAALNQTAGG